MSKIVVLLIIFLFVSYLQIAQANSSIVINEFLVDPDNEQQVELYNSGGESVDISGWFIDDDGGTQKFTIPANTTLPSGQFKSFKSGLFNFNRTSSDTIQLIKDNDVVDSKSYSQIPGTGKSLGRQPDGSDNWLVFDTPTWDQSNNGVNGQPLPSPTPTPSPSPTPSTSSTSSPTSTPKASPTTAKSSSPKPLASPAVLGESETQSTPQSSLDTQQSSPSPSPNQEAVNPSKTKVAGMLTGSGIILVGLSVGFYLWYKRVLGKSEKEKDENQI